MPYLIPGSFNLRNITDYSLEADTNRTFQRDMTNIFSTGKMKATDLKEKNKYENKIFSIQNLSKLPISRFPCGYV